jgi:hypothetical protein
MGEGMRQRHAESVDCCILDTSELGLVYVYASKRLIAKHKEV